MNLKRIAFLLLPVITFGLIGASDAKGQENQGVQFSNIMHDPAGTTAHIVQLFDDAQEYFPKGVEYNFSAGITTTGPIDLRDNGTTYGEEPLADYIERYSPEDFNMLTVVEKGNGEAQYTVVTGSDKRQENLTINDGNAGMGTLIDAIANPVAEVDSAHFNFQAVTDGGDCTLTINGSAWNADKNTFQGDLPYVMDNAVLNTSVINHTTGRHREHREGYASDGNTGNIEETQYNQYGQEIMVETSDILTVEEVLHREAALSVVPLHCPEAIDMLYSISTGELLR